MTIRRYPAIAHEHGDLRHEIASCALVLATPNRPPEGHAFHGVLQAAADYFQHELPHHVTEEEAVFYPSLVGLVPAAGLARMREQHQALLVMATMFLRQHQLFVAGPSDAGWAELRHIGARLLVAVEQHLDDEEAILVGLRPA